MRIQPKEAIYVKMVNKTPGLGLETGVSELDLTYDERFPAAYIPDAYERLILDAIRGDQQHFVRRWGFVGFSVWGLELRPGRSLQKPAACAVRPSASTLHVFCALGLAVACRDELRAAWAVFTPLLHAIERKEVEVHQYAAGSRGPKQADEMIAQAGYVKNEARARSLSRA